MPLTLTTSLPFDRKPSRGTLAPAVSDAPAQPDRPAAGAPDDQSLIDAAAAGDHRAFETLYHRYRDWAFSLAWRFTRDHHASMDLVQETFLEIARRAPAITLRGKLTSYLYPIIRHRAIDAARRRKLHTRAMSELAPAAAATVDAASAEHEFGPLLAAVEQLPEHEREVLLMRYASGMALADIAEALRLPLGTVKSRLHGATTTLRARLHE